MSAYLLGNIIFTIAWLVLFVFSKQTRKIQLFGSLLLLPFVVLDIWFRPIYWHPPLLIKAIEPLSLETAIYCFTAGGIAAVFGQWIFRSKFSRISWQKTLLFLLVSFAFYAIFQGFEISSAMNNLNFAFLLVWAALFAINPKENIKSLLPAALFAVFTIGAINLATIFYPNFVAEYWNLGKLWPTFLGTPTEEIFFAAILAALWSLMPKYTPTTVRESNSIF